MAESNYFELLNVIRDSGVMNMAAAPQLLRDEFGLSKNEARRIFKLWIEHLKREAENANSV